MTLKKTGWRRTGENEVKPNITYNNPDNEVMVRTDENFIYVICKKESQTDKVVQKLTTPKCKLVSYEEWDEGCLLYTSPSPRDRQKSRMPSSA